MLGKNGAAARIVMRLRLAIRRNHRRDAGRETVNSTPLPRPSLFDLNRAAVDFDEPPQNDLDGVADRSERIAKFVGERRQEFVFLEIGIA